jgi:HSP20 family protein
MALPILRRGGSPISVRRTDGTTQNALSAVDPWNDFEVLNRLFDSVFPSPFSAFRRGLTHAAQTADPGLELYETADELMAFVVLPGMVRDKFDIAATADNITIQGERTPLLDVSSQVTSHTPWTNWAIGSGTFSATYTLPVEIDPAKIQAEYKDGVLYLRMPKSEAAKPKQVKVEVAKS